MRLSSYTQRAISAIGSLSDIRQRAATVLLAASKRARRLREKGEFDMRRILPITRPPLVPMSSYSWSLDEIRAARDSQMIGRFLPAVRLAESMRTDEALFAAYEARLAPQRCLDVEILPGRGARAMSIAAEAEALFGNQGCGIHPDTMSDIMGNLANHGVAFAYNVPNPRADGSRVDFELRSWPQEFVYWHAATRTWVTRIQPFNSSVGTFGFQTPGEPDPYGAYAPRHGVSIVPIVHGDGRWVVFQKHDFLPHRQDAAILPGALIWARHAFASCDWIKGSASHGNAKVWGTLPEGVSLQNSDELTPEAAAFLALLQSVQADDAPVGIAPNGASVNYVTNSSSSWEVWSELMLSAEKAAMRVYTGTDASLGSQGGGPGIDVETLLGVSTVKVQGDLEALQRGFRTGVIEPWCAINFGDSSQAPERRYLIPDTDADAARESLTTRLAAFNTAIAALKSNGFVVDQETAEELASQYGIKCPTLAVADAPVANPVTTPAQAPLSLVPKT